MKKIIIAIDGFSSCGKSSFAKLIAKKYSYAFIDTGAMYRAVTLYALNKGFIEGEGIDRCGLVNSLDDISIRIENNNNQNVILLNGEDVSQAIRTLEVSEHVSLISSISEVREAMVDQQQRMGQERGIVMDGRDIGTVVFPDAELKIFMTASVDVRAERRYKELLERGDKVSFSDIQDNISKRDHLDQTREISPLKQATDALLLDNSNMTVEEQMIWVEEVISKL